MPGQLDDFLSPYVQTEDDSSDDSDSSADQAVQGAVENSTIKQLRQEIKRRDKALKEWSKELEDLRSFRSEVTNRERENTVKSAFREAGLSEKQAALYLRVNEGDVTPESITNFLTEYDLAPGQTDQQQERQAPQQFAPTHAPGAQAPSQTPGAKVSRAELERLMKANPSEAQRLFNAGLVDWSNDLHVNRK